MSEDSKPIKGVVIYTDGTYEEKVFKQLTDYQDAVGGWITSVRLFSADGKEYANMYVNDEGLLIGLEPNPMASAISFMLNNTPMLVGNAVIVGKGDGEGYDLDIDEGFLTFLKQILSVKVAANEMD